MLKRSLQSANEITEIINQPFDSDFQKSREVKIQSESTKETLIINPEDICFISSQGNYVLVFIFVNGVLMKKTLRATLKNIETYLNEFEFIFRCHRAFVVNLKLITKIKGNAQGMRINLRNCPEIILVSRNYIPAFKASMKKHSGLNH